MMARIRASLGLVYFVSIAIGMHLKDDLANIEPSKRTAHAKCTTNCSGAELGVAGRRLWHADVADVEDFPYAAAVTRGAEVWCGAAIIKPNFLLTTANCFWLIKHPEESMSVVYGVSRIDGNFIQKNIEKVTKHPQWKPPPHPPDYDIAVIFLRQSIEFNAIVHDVELPTRRQKPLLKEAYVTGFGWSEENDFEPRIRTLPYQLRSYLTEVKSHSACAEILASRLDTPLSDRFICLASAPQKAPCVRDTGAPAVSDGVLWGLASWSVREACGDKRWPVLFTSVAEKSNLDFVQLTIDRQTNDMEAKVPPSYV